MLNVQNQNESKIGTFKRYTIYALLSLVVILGFTAMIWNSEAEPIDFLQSQYRWLAFVPQRTFTFGIGALIILTQPWSKVPDPMTKNGSLAICSIWTVWALFHTYLLVTGQREKNWIETIDTPLLSLVWISACIVQHKRMKTRCTIKRKAYTCDRSSTPGM